MPKSRDWESPTSQSRKRKKKKTEISNDDRPQSFKKHICEKRKQTNTENLKGQMIGSNVLKTNLGGTILYVHNLPLKFLLAFCPLFFN